MPTPVDWPRWQRFKREIEACLREGFVPPHGTGGKGSALMEAERRLRAAGAIVGSGNGRLFHWLRIQEKRKKRGQDHACPDWTAHRRQHAVRIDATSRVKERWILTSAQNDAPLHRPFWANLRAFAHYLGARIHVGRFTYQVAYVNERDRNGGKKVRKHLWAPELAEFLTSERFSCGDVLFCAEMNTLPTAVRPLSDLHTYGQGRTAIFPHAKVALETVAAAPGDVPPAVLTTGCVTLPDYTDTKAGHKGVFHHVFAAVIVEQAEDGATFFRHIVARQDGTFQDLDLLVREGRVVAGQRAEAITFGDIQSPFVDPEKALGTWGFDARAWAPADYTQSIVDQLRPRFGFYHDLVDFKSISHHDRDKTREQFRKFIAGQNSVEADLARAARFLRDTSREFMKSIVVKSNHDRWLDRWLDTADIRKDQVNAIAFHHLAAERLRAIAGGDADFDTLKCAITQQADLPGVTWLPEDGSFIICQDSGGIECGSHGDLGPNGGSAAPKALARVSGKANIGDKHAPAIVDGLYVAGTSSLLRLGFNKGPSSWRHADIVTYPTGKRTLIFYHGARFRA